MCLQSEWITFFYCHCSSQLVFPKSLHAHLERSLLPGVVLDTMLVKPILYLTGSVVSCMWLSCSSVNPDRYRHFPVIQRCTSYSVWFCSKFYFPGEYKQSNVSSGLTVWTRAKAESDQNIQIDMMYFDYNWPSNLITRVHVNTVTAPELPPFRLETKRCKTI